jgi:hypothetical protein
MMGEVYAKIEQMRVDARFRFTEEKKEFYEQNIKMRRQGKE